MIGHNAAQLFISIFDDIPRPSDQERRFFSVIILFYMELSSIKCLEMRIQDENRADFNWVIALLRATENTRWHPEYVKQMKFYENVMFEKRSPRVANCCAPKIKFILGIFLLYRNVSFFHWRVIPVVACVWFFQMFINHVNAEKKFEIFYEFILKSLWSGTFWNNSGTEHFLHLLPWNIPIKYVSVWVVDVVVRLVSRVAYSYAEKMRSITYSLLIHFIFFWLIT